MKSTTHIQPIRDLLFALRIALFDTQVKALLLISFSQIGFATVIYHWLEKWSWVDAFYFSVITIATVGYGDLAPKTDLGKLFTVGYILLGIGMFVTTTATLASKLLIAMSEHAKSRQESPHSPIDKINKNDAQ